MIEMTLSSRHRIRNSSPGGPRDPREVLLAQFSLYVHKGGLMPDSFHFVLHVARSAMLLRSVLSLPSVQRETTVHT